MRFFGKNLSEDFFAQNKNGDQNSLCSLISYYRKEKEKKTEFELNILIPDHW